MQFWAELRRRNVLRVAGAYLVVAWIAVQVVDAAMDALNLPDWFDGAVFVLLAAAFPIVLIIAWAFESRDGQIVRTEPGGPPAQFRSIDGVLIAAIAVLIVVSVVQIARPGRPAQTAAAEAAPEAAPAVAQAPQPLSAAGPSIAVLPFLDLSPEGDQAYFADGLSEELLNAFAKIDGLRVIARTSSFAFRDRAVDAREVGAALDVAHLLDGSVRKAGDQLRIRAQLIDARDGSEVWSDTYDRQLTDIFVIQDEIAMAVADTLSVTLGLAAAADNGDTDSAAALEHYFRGRDLIARFDAAAALEEFRRATAIDPDYALAWTGVARAAQQLSIVDAANAAELQAVWLEAVQRAREIAPGLWQAHSLYGLLMDQRLDWAEAERAFDETARLGANETDDEWASSYATFLSDVGRMTEALAVVERARDANPLSLQISNALAWAYSNLGRQDDAAAERERSIGLAGNHDIWAYTHLTQLLAEGDRGAVASAVAAFPFDTFGTADGVVNRWVAAWDQPESANAALRRFLGDDQAVAAMRGTGQIGALAPLAAYHGDTALALGILNAWVATGGVSPVHLWHPLLAPLRGTEEFKQIVRDFGLVDFWRETGNWGDYCRPLGDDDFACA